MKLKPTIICVDDDGGVLNGLRSELAHGLGPDYRIEISDSGEDGLELLQELLDDGYDVPLIISDQLMPGMKGDEFLIRVHEIRPQIRKILLTGQAGADAVGRALNLAALYRYIAKPWEPDDLLMTVRQALKSYQDERRALAGERVIQALYEYAVNLSQHVRIHGWAAAFANSLLKDLHADRILVALLLDGKPFRIEARSAMGQIQPAEIDDARYRDAYPHEEIDAVAAETPLRLLPAGKDGAGSAVLFPLAKQHFLLGACYIEKYRAADHFDKARTDFLTALAPQAAVSLDNALLYESLELKVRERTRVIEEKSQDLADSIQYARRIQYAILSNPATVTDLYPQFFTFYKPKDVVSGDFYWFHRQGDALFIAAVDCTGHGVPGAFMSVLGATLLKQIVAEQGVLNPHEILETLHMLVYRTLIQNRESMKVLDGMDMAVCRIDAGGRRLHYAGANRPILHYTGGELFEIKPDKQAIGGLSLNDTFEMRRFTAHTLDLKPGDTLYFYTDGVADQFGGPEGRKFSSRRFAELLQEIARRPIDVQAGALQAAFDGWRGTLPQTDDVLVMGLRV